MLTIQAAAPAGMARETAVSEAVLLCHRIQCNVRLVWGGEVIAIFKDGERAVVDHGQVVTGPLAVDQAGRTWIGPPMPGYTGETTQAKVPDSIQGWM